MCGIVGSVGIANINPKVTQTLFHRGPDGQGEQSLSVRGKSIWLAHTRLSILDLSLAGHQPMQSRDGRWWLTYNGEIYNHLALREGLSGPFRGHSDTETLVELLAAQGIDRTLPQLNGMFAFAALDLIKAKLHLVRDPFGIKPIYYMEDNDFAFSSEIRALPFLISLLWTLRRTKFRFAVTPNRRLQDFKEA
jgi:asparagine synthase (glutamine-hydrolysing)